MEINIDVLKKSTPKHLRSFITDDLVDMLNNSKIDDTVIEEYKENFISYMSVLTEGKYKITDYLNAVKYVTYKMLGRTNEEAYTATFPERYTKLSNRGVTDISSYASAYNSNKLVVSIMQQVLVPVWITNAQLHQQAINEQFKLGTNPSVSPMVRAKALDSVLTHTKAPETKQLNIDIGISQTDDLQQLQNTMKQLAEQQKDMIQKGYSTKSIVESRIIDVEVVDE